MQTLHVYNSNDAVQLAVFHSYVLGKKQVINADTEKIEKKDYHILSMRHIAFIYFSLNLLLNTKNFIRMV